MTNAVYTKREIIAKTFAQYLSLISVATGYRNDFPTAQHWSTNIEPKENGMTVNVKDRLNNNSSGEENESERLRIEVLLGCTVTSPTDSNYRIMSNMIDDVKRCIWFHRKEIETALNLERIKYVSDDIEIAQDEKQVGAGKVTFEVLTGENSDWFYDDTQFDE